MTSTSLDDQEDLLSSAPNSDVSVVTLAGSGAFGPGSKLRYNFQLAKDVLTLLNVQLGKAGQKNTGHGPPIPELRRVQWLEAGMGLEARHMHQLEEKILKPMCKGQQHRENRRLC